MPEIHELIPGPIACHCWNGDRTKLALSPNNNEVHIYSKKGSKFEKETELNKHGQRVTGMDWAAKSNQLVTCAADRNAYVWTFNDGEWKPSLVILRINRAATIVKWSPKENKFAVGSGARVVSICYFEEENDWWVSKHIKKPLRSTVLSVDWHPNNYLVGVGSSDFKARVFSAYVKEIEEKPSSTPWGKKMNFGNMMGEYSNGSGGWVHDVSFSPSGNKLGWVGHDSSISVMDPTSENGMATVKFRDLPYLACNWVTENSLICAGYDCYPVLFNHDDNGQLSFINKLDQTEKKSEGEYMSAMAKFKGLDKRGQSSTNDTTITSTHQNAITQIFPHTVSGGSVSKFCTTGIDGRLVIWDCKSLESLIAGLKFQ